MRNVLFSLALAAWATVQPAAADKNSELLPKIMAKIMAACTQEWGANYRMIEHCRTRQLNAEWEMSDILYGQAQREPYQSMLLLCFNEWMGTFGPNAIMIVYCYNRQVESYERLQRQ